MTTTSLRDKQALQEQLEQALGEQPTGADLVELVIRSGWQPRPVPNPDSDYIDGLLDNGSIVTIEIRHASRQRVG